MDTTRDVRLVNVYRIGLRRTPWGRLVPFRSSGCDGDPAVALDAADRSDHWHGVAIVDVQTNEEWFVPSSTPAKVAS